MLYSLVYDCLCYLLQPPRKSGGGTSRHTDTQAIQRINWICLWAYSVLKCNFHEGVVETFCPFWNCLKLGVLLNVSQKKRSPTQKRDLLIFIKMLWLISANWCLFTFFGFRTDIGLHLKRSRQSAPEYSLLLKKPPTISKKFWPPLNLVPKVCWA